MAKKQDHGRALLHTEMFIAVCLLALISGAMAAILDRWFGIFFGQCPGVPISGALLMVSAPVIPFLCLALVIAVLNKSWKENDFHGFLFVFYVAATSWAWLLFLQGHFFCIAPLI